MERNFVPTTNTFRIMTADNIRI